MLSKISTLLIFAFAFVNYTFATDIKQISESENPRYLMKVKHGITNLGEIEFESFPEIAPKHSHNLDSLVSIQFYDRTAFHRVIPNFMIQGGDPNSKNKSKETWGTGDPSQTKVPAEFSTTKKHLRGTLSAARTNDPNSATSQFFICVVPTPWLDGQYSIYGQVLSGMDVVDMIVNVQRDAKDNPIEKVEMTIERLASSSVTENLYNSGNIKIYPNPTSTSIGFQLENANIFVKSATITDISGKQYFSQEFANTTIISELSIPVADFYSGVYIVTLTDGNGAEFKLRFVIN
ncbi:MAG: peptidylprolyl isomerase [Desulfobulbaceae bacterium]|nr:peptidylprolyl isomerase [Desulfobulbaceae bacterium]